MWATTAARLVDLARANDYDLIILDLMMPELDGLEACMEIRAFSSVPIIMLTARGEDTDKLLGFEYRGGRLHHKALQHPGGQGPGKGPPPPGGHSPPGRQSGRTRSPWAG